MSWQNLPADASTDWTSIDFLTQFKAAYDERFFGLIGAGPSIEVGDDPFNFIAELQYNLEHYATGMPDPAKIAAGDLDAPYYTLASWRAAAGLNPSGFTRKYLESGQLTTAYGYMQWGDYYGPWLFNELQAGLQAISLLMSGVYGRFQNGSGGPAISPSAAKQDAMDHFPTQDSVAARSDLSKYTSISTGALGDWFAYIENSLDVCPMMTYKSAVAHLLNSTATMWLKVYPQDYSFVFDGYGSGIVDSPGTWQQVSDSFTLDQQDGNQFYASTRLAFGGGGIPSPFADAGTTRGFEAACRSIITPRFQYP